MAGVRRASPVLAETMTKQQGLLDCPTQQATQPSRCTSARDDDDTSHGSLLPHVVRGRPRVLRDALRAGAEGRPLAGSHQEAAPNHDLLAAGSQDEKVDGRTKFCCTKNCPRFVFLIATE